MSTGSMYVCEGVCVYVYVCVYVKEKDIGRVKDIFM